jgi:hypothetical protein
VKPPEIFEILREHAFRSESDNKGKYTLSRGEAPEKRLNFKKSDL